MFRYRMLSVIGFVLVGFATDARGWAQVADGSLAIEALRDDAFPILPWDEMRAIDGPEDRVHGLASLVDFNFTYAGFPHVEDLPPCEKLGLRAIVYPAGSLGLTKPAHLSDEQIDKAVRTLV